MRMEARLRKLEQTPFAVLWREVVFPGLSQEDAEREARAMVERGEIAADDFVLGVRPRQDIDSPVALHHGGISRLARRASGKVKR